MLFSQEADDKRLGRRVFNPFLAQYDLGESQWVCFQVWEVRFYHFGSIYIALRRRDQTGERAGHLAIK